MSAQFICPDGHIRCVVDLGECPVCHKKMVIEAQSDWIDQLLSNDQIWIIDRVVAFPEVISSEYLRLHQLMQEKKIYGAYYKIKDIIEAILKFYILTICAWSNETKNKVFNKSVLPLITTPNLSLGSWLALGSRITSYYRSSDEHAPEILIDGLEKVVRFYQRHNFVNWRNEKIAHGALALSDTIEFKSDVEQKLSEFVDLFSEIGGTLESIRLDNIHNDDGPVTILLLPQMTKFTAEPFICRIGKEIYFFDNQKNEKCTKLQCYKTGATEARLIPFFSELRKLLVEKKIDQAEPINEKYRSLEEERALDLVGIDTEFIEPEFITDWLREQIVSLPKGVFSLEMSRGMGKSMYTERISSLQKNPVIILPELEVRTYHVTRSQLLGKADFETAIETQWVTDYHNNIWVGAPRFKDFANQTDNARESFVMLLKECLKYINKKHDKSKILMVLDGLDEINDTRIWDYLPSEKQLPNNIYLLLTFRDTEKDVLSPAIIEHLRNIQLTKKLLVDARTDQYMLFMKSYIDSMIKNIPSEIYSTLIELSDYKMLNLAPVCKLVKYGYPIKDMNSTEDILSAYWHELQKQYGPSEFSHLKEIASFFCQYSDESVSIHDLAYLYYSNKVTYGLLGILSDMMPFLSVERGYVQNNILYQGENRYRFANTDTSETLKSLIPDYRDTVYASLYTIVEEISTVAEKQAPHTIPFNEDDLVIFAHSMPIEKNIKEFFLNIGETETTLYGKNAQGDLIKEEISHAIIQYNASEALALVLTQPVNIFYQYHKISYKPGPIERSVVKFLQKQETVAKMQVKQHIFKACEQMCKIYDGFSLSDADYRDYYLLIRIIAGIFILEGSYESAIRRYIQLLDKMSSSCSSDKMNLIQKHVLVDVAEIYLKMGKFLDAQKFYNAALGMNGKEINAISLAAYTGLLKALNKTGDIESAITMAENLKVFLLDTKNKDLLDSDYDYFTLYCDACFEYIHYLNHVEKEVPDIDFYQSCELTIDMITTLVLNIIENAHRNSRLRNYDLLIDLYTLEGQLHLKPHKLNKLDYTDYAIIYFQQVLKLYNKARQNGEHVDQQTYDHLVDLIKKLMKRVNKSSPSYFISNSGGGLVSKKVDVKHPPEI